MPIDARRRWASVLLAVALLGAHAQGRAQDTPEMLAAMRAALPPVPSEVPPWDALPPELRREVPAFTVQAHRWHADPAQALVQINGRRVEKDGVADRELWLREVREDGVVLQFRDQFFFHPR